MKNRSEIWPKFYSQQEMAIYLKIFWSQGWNVGTILQTILQT